MPRAARNVPGDVVYHVLNRANGRRQLFYKDGDYAAFVKLLAEATARFPTRLLGYCLMPSHWHLVLWPRQDGELSLFMRWLTNTHVRRYHQHYHTYGQGHIYRGRFRSFPVQQDEHLLTVLRYVEANAARAGEVDEARQWPWSSLTFSPKAPAERRLLSEWPVKRPRNWVGLVNTGLGRDQVEAIRNCVRRGRPFGDEDWITLAARRMGLSFTLNPRGRPPKK